MINIDHINDLDDITKEEALDIIRRKKQYKLTDRAVELLNRILYKHKIRVSRVDKYGSEKSCELSDYTDYKTIRLLWHTYLQELTVSILDVSNPNRLNLINKKYKIFCEICELNSILTLFVKAEKTTEPIKKKLIEQNEIEMSLIEDENAYPINDKVYMTDESLEILKRIINDKGCDFENYYDLVLNIHYGTKKKLRKKLLNLFYLMPYIHYHDNYICNYTWATESKGYKRLTLNQICEICGYNKEDIKQLKKDLINLMVYDNEYVFGIWNDNYVDVNPYVFWFYPICDNDKEYCKSQQKRMGDWFRIGKKTVSTIPNMRRFRIITKDE